MTTQKEVKAWADRVHSVKQSAEPTRSIRVNSLLNDLKNSYDIPPVTDIRFEEFRSSHPYITRLYQSIELMVS